MLNISSFYRGKRVLLLQGPRGLFFWRLKKDLESFGATVYKINLNGGDFIFYPINCINYRGRREDWPVFFEEFIEKNRIDIVLLFSDFRYYHKVAREICNKHKILVGCFEEGYIRPDFVTLDFNGANGYSKLVYKEFDFQSWQPPIWFKIIKNKVGNSFYHEVFYANVYYIFANLLFPFYPFYRHHISLYLPGCLWKEAYPWIRSGIRKIYYKIKEKKLKRFIFEDLKGRYFLVPLQVHNDSQVTIHSSFKTVENFIDCVIQSFARNARDGYLILKHHPRDRGYKDYGRLIKRLTKKYNIDGRVLYIHDAHLPTLIDNSIGVVVINSSVGMQALEHGKPVKTIGRSIYNKPLITFQGHLDEFWNVANEFKMDKTLFSKLRSFILFHTQLNGSLHKRVNKETFTGISFISIESSLTTHDFEKSLLMLKGETHA